MFKRKKNKDICFDYYFVIKYVGYIVDFIYVVNNFLNLMNFCMFKYGLKY